MRTRRQFLATLALAFVFAWAGCGGGGGNSQQTSASSQPGNTETASAVSVVASPDSVWLAGGQSQNFTAELKNDTGNKGVSWSLSAAVCSGSGCGTLTKITPTSVTYTAPAVVPSDMWVKLTATSVADSMKTWVVTIYLMQIRVSVSPFSSANLVSESRVFTATVQHDFQGAGVRWELQRDEGCAGGICGELSNATPTSVVYTAPPTVPVVPTVGLKASSVADPAKSTIASITILPLTVYLFPSGNVTSAAGGVRQFQAQAGSAGVMWTVAGAGCSGDSCGTLSDISTTAAIYHAPVQVPNPPEVTLTATSIADNSRSAVAVITISATATPSVLKGKYAFLMKGFSYGTMETLAGHLEADGNGNLTGVWDVNRMGAMEHGQTISGSYEIQADGQGTMSIHDGPTTFTYNVTFDASGDRGMLAESTVMFTPDLRGSSGYLARQDATSFVPSSVDGDRVAGFFGDATYTHVGAVGRFTSNGGMASGVMDLTWRLHQNVAAFTNRVTISGPFTAPDPITGRGTVTLQITGDGDPVPYHFAYYLVSPELMLVVQTDARGLSPNDFSPNLLMPTLGGEIRVQKRAGSFTNAALNAPAIFALIKSELDLVSWSDEYAVSEIGQVSPSGSGALTARSDWNARGSVQLNVNATGNYSVETTGRATVSIPGPPMGFWTPRAAVAYLADENTGYMLREGLFGISVGWFEPQSAGPFDTHSLAGKFFLNTAVPACANVENDSGWITFAADGTAAATLYVNTGTGATRHDLAGTFTVTSNGRGTASLDTSPPSGQPQQLVFWAISPNHIIALPTVNSSPPVFDLRRAGQQ